ncbi:hypothetical protein KXX26_008781, partial [Aspergillus fumigatus]
GGYPTELPTERRGRGAPPATAPCPFPTKQRGSRPKESPPPSKFRVYLQGLRRR